MAVFVDHTVGGLQESAQDVTTGTVHFHSGSSVDAIRGQGLRLITQNKVSDETKATSWGRGSGWGVRALVTISTPATPDVDFWGS